MTTFQTPLWEPGAILKLIERLPANDENFLLNRFSKVPWLGDGQTVEWDVIRHGQKMARPNTRGAKAHTVGHQGRGQMQARGIYAREVKLFDASVVRKLRDPGQLVRANAEKYIAREIADLNNRFDRFVEYCLWGLLTGSLTLYYQTPGALINQPVSIDYGLPAANKPTVGTSWATATPPQIVADIRAWRKIIENTSGVSPKEAFASEQVISYIFDSFAANGDAGTLMAGALMSDRMKDEYQRSGTLPEFMELAWRRTRQVYDPDNGGALTPFFAEKSLIIGDFTTNSPIYIFETAPEDIEAPAGARGKHSKSWDDKDPSGRSWLLEYGFCPVDERPDQRVYIADVTA